MKNTIIGTVVAIVVSVALSFVLLHKAPQVVKLGAITTGSGTPTSFDGISVNGGVRQGVPSSEYPVLPASQTTIGNGLATLVVSGSFSNASNTVALIANPFNATSTVTFAQVAGLNGTSTIDILVGTTSVTSTQSITNNAQVSPNLIKATSIATSTNFFSVAGAQSGPTGAGYYNNPGAGSGMIVVGPSDLVAIFATSSNANYAAAVTGVTSTKSGFAGTYTFEFQR